MISRLNEIGRFYGLEINMRKKGNENLKAPFHTTNCGRSKPAGECGIFKIFW
jgi:hypothetical protein